MWRGVVTEWLREIGGRIVMADAGRWWVSPTLRLLDRIASLFRREERICIDLKSKENFLQRLRLETNQVYSAWVFKGPLPYYRFGVNAYVSGEKILLRDDRAANYFGGTLNYFEGDIVEEGGGYRLVGRFKKPVYSLIFPAILILFTSATVLSFIYESIMKRIGFIDIFIFVLIMIMLVPITIFFIRSPLSVRYRSIKKNLFGLLNSCAR